MNYPDFGALLVEHSIAVAFKTIPYMLFSLLELVFMGAQLTFFGHAMLRRVSDVLQGFRARVQQDLRPESVLLLEYSEDRRVVVVRKLQLELRVGRMDVVLGILELCYRAHYRLLLVFLGIRLAIHLMSELAAFQVIVYLPQLVL